MMGVLAELIFGVLDFLFWDFGFEVEFFYLCDHWIIIFIAVKIVQDNIFFLEFGGLILDAYWCCRCQKKEYKRWIESMIFVVFLAPWLHDVLFARLISICCEWSTFEVLFTFLDYWNVSILSLKLVVGSHLTFTIYYFSVYIIDFFTRFCRLFFMQIRSYLIWMNNTLYSSLSENSIFSRCMLSHRFLIAFTLLF